MQPRRHCRTLPRTARYLLAGSLFLLSATGPAIGGTPVKIGRTTAPDASHLPVYVAMEAGLFAQEGLDASFVTMTKKALTTAGLAGTVDFVPLPAAGAEAALRGAALRFVTGQSLFTPSALVVPRRIRSVEQLRHRKLGLGQIGQAGYDDGEFILRDRFGLVAGRDYDAIAIPGEQNRFVALEQGDIDAGFLSLLNAARAESRGFRRLFRTGVFRPRIKGAIWVRTSFLNSNRETVRGFIRAIAKATEMIHTDGGTTVKVIQKYLGLHRWEDAKSFWHSVRDTYSADIPARLLSELFADRRQRLQQKGLWPRQKPAPPAERFVARALLRKTLYQRRYTQETISVFAPVR